MAQKQSSSVVSRPPIIAVLGHVDHGKTSLLDAIRSTNVAAGESGGITQHIGAYQVTYQNRLITFIDTPGHAAFTSMRKRGGQIADLAILVVAADDGVMPQTRESISHITSAGIPFVVALNKIDLPGTQPHKIKGQLAEAGVLVEGFGGNVPIVEVSATSHQNIDLLLETLLLMADLAELKADPDVTLNAVVIESSLSKTQGPLATVIVKNGTIKKGDSLGTLPSAKEKSISAKARALLDWNGKNLEVAGPSTPVQILGFETVPPVGAIVTNTKDLKDLETQLETVASQIDGKEEKNQINIILKADVVGTLEAIISSLPTNLHIIHAGTGAINESDILLADTSNAKLFGFRVTPTASAKKLASIEKISIFTFETIYDLLDHLKAISEKKIKDEAVDIILGEASVLKVFDFPDFRVIGASVSSGAFRPNDTIHLKRQDGTVKNAIISSLKVGTKDVTKVKTGEEFGVILNPQLDTKPGDILIAFKRPQEDLAA